MRSGVMLKAQRINGKRADEVGELENRSQSSVLLKKGNKVNWIFSFHCDLQRGGVERKGQCENSAGGKKNLLTGTNNRCYGKEMY